MSKTYKAVNWNTPENDYVLMFWEQNIRQFWIDTEYIPSKDIDSWKRISPEMKDAYKKALGGLTLLDTLQSHTGMPKIIDHIDTLQNKAVLSYMCMMEAIHAKSYSTIFTTVSTTAEINDIFEWVQQNKYLQYKAETIDGYYRAIDKEDASDEEIYMAMAASVLLESFLFYSGFFLPLWLCGQGEMVASADIIKKIIADESIHGVFVGLIAQDQFKKLKNQDQVKARFLALLYNLYENELKYTEEIYTEVGLTAEVKEYVRYNANKALMNLGFDPIFEVKQVNPIVLNGLNTETTQHDFFSKKSTNYEKATEIVHLKDDDFKMDVVVDI
ncbi:MULTISPECIES: class 1b ribonucleoside-diphosphate reductase subunit beta [Sphingobacterium]|jgi:ribonucleoside-diphosphate reductase beta chain|uniref:Class 1b ribonucleoside-diphosphate reductase subunit beta n=6 Tax=Sphingobacterium TaxID=28453 RepID=A0ACD5BY96_9SPHI|nr:MULTISPECIES: class 1b ribonucleoside-diphosphate reductase subunit beta [Sphingobacterium]APU99354.1 class 1b ribonucleoside-diphosphate reductase subunit beta [Sphingobacterium sp. B29]MBB1644299.1 class 1b ribonucleoside-diphosphate reductase subunit beta [Sphingobacterium sp. UME9]MCS4166462.1 ribonucleoside-diphosphate reductase beta chain [Sphingobacterium sp. BIGb0116]MDR3010040.1 class 1b ribonucleoside-diphosphate reductase subunit beta [Sphingobacterium sp.]OFV09108.1 ribonucleoti